MEEKALVVKDLKTYFKSGDLLIRAVDGVNFTLRKGKVLGIIGESGSGKSVTARSIMRIVESTGVNAGGEILCDGEDLLKLPESKMRTIRGDRISLIFQDPTTSFNPYMKVGEQLIEVYRTHTGGSREAARAQALKALKLVGINDGERVMKKYPCQFSAGFRQRIFIAMSMILEPEILIADEPTTSLGITIQAEIIESLKEVQKETGISIIIITHDFGVVSQFSDDVFVMYAGKCVESAPKKVLLTAPCHPYSVGLLQSVPLLEERKTKKLKSIPGFPPNMSKLPEGCAFASRCKYATETCRQKAPELTEIGEGHKCACHHPLLDYHTDEDTELGV